MRSRNSYTAIANSIVCLFLATGQAFGEQPDQHASAEVPTNLPPLQVSIDKSKVDLENGRLELKMSRTASHVELKVLDAEGNLIAKRKQDFSGKAAGAVLVVQWPQTGAENVARIEVFAHDAFGYYKGVAIIPWSLEIPHQELNFALDSAKIEKREEPKLEESYSLIKAALKKHKDLGPITLYIAGHTDTLGSAAHNADLSGRRARAIARWFRKRGLGIPIRYEGFGEFALKVKTADEVGEPKNRRVDYLLAVETPRFKTTGRVPVWKAP